MGRDYTRRQFLKTVVITAGAVQAAPLLGCGDSGGTTVTPDAPAGKPDAGGPAVVFAQSVVSGDPRPDSIVLWTRAAPATSGDVSLSLDVATDDQFTQLVTLSTSSVTAKSAADNCVRVKVTGLTAGTRYFYRFRAGAVTSPTGRFKTAAAAGTAQPVKFAVLSCQDYVGRYYNTLLALLDPANDDMDFVLHLGDYIYETTGDPAFQATNGRGVTFSDTAGAIQFGTGSSAFYAAKSLSNYRDLYKTYRSDPTLQKLHEKFAFVLTWDDHEYSNDCWQDCANYYDGIKGDEHDPERRRNAEQAFFEYHAIAVDAESTGELALSRDQLWPNMKIYRDFRFGKHLHLIVTDFRSFRPDHPIPEYAFPGTVVMDQAATLATLTAVLGSADAANAAFAASPFPGYVNLDDAAFATHKATAKTVLTAAYTAAGADATRAGTLATTATTGNVDVTVLNSLWDSLSAEQKAALTVPTDGLKRGISFAAMGKASLFGQIGSRYLVVKPTYDLWAAYRVAQDPTSDDPYQAAQQTWLDGKLAAEADATWKVLGSSTSQTSLIVDLTNFASMLPPSVPPTQLYMDCDGWDGFPVGRQQLHAKLTAKNVVIVSGDIHASYIADFGADNGGNRLIELTGPAVSSQVFRDELKSEAELVPALQGSPIVDELIAIIDMLLHSANDTMLKANSTTNGVIVVTVTGVQLQGVYSLLDAAETLTDQTGSPTTVAGKTTKLTVTVPKSGGKNGPATLS